MKKHWDNFFVPPEMDEFLDKVKIDFAKSFEVDDQVTYCILDDLPRCLFTSNI